MLALALALTLAADPRSEAEALTSVLKRAAEETCASDGGSPSLCARVKAFQAAKPASGKVALFSIGTMEEVDSSAQVLQLLDLSAEGVTVGLLEPDDDDERKQFLSIIEGLKRGQRKDPLLLAVAKDARSLPHFPATAKEGSLVFQVPAVLGGHWLRSVPGKILMVSFNGDTHRPKLRFSEFPDDRK
jgi:hypothetical protein